MIYLLGNNARLETDGIGDYLGNLYDAIASAIGSKNITLITGFSGHAGRLEQISSLVMSKSLLSIKKKIRNGDIVIIEYPFAECNYIFALFLFFFKIKLRKKNGTLILSLHEYFRTNFIRRLLIRQIVPNADIVLVTDQKTQAWVSSKFKRPTYVRTIPSNIYVGEKNHVVKDRNLFVFFGLISKTKAFNEMVEAWKAFNKDKLCKLLIITSSQCVIREENGIHIVRGASKETVANYLAAASFCILPIIPCVSCNNATYKSAIGYNCIPIGVFDEQIGDMNAHIMINSNSVEDLRHGLEKAYCLQDKERIEYFSALKRRTKPTFEETAKEYEKIISQLL